jgi:acetolactate synthase-1/2/3 large subunit
MPRGADIVAQTLEALGVSCVFTLSGNHIMPIFDALLATDIRVIHVRHEAACVHMADAWGRLTGRPGVALVTGGQGHSNAVAALYTALASESPLLLLSGHAPLSELGRGAFQEMAQADLARPVTKASWTAQSAATLGADIAKAFELATAGRPGPVHISLPVDLLEQAVSDDQIMPMTADQSRAPIAPEMCDKVIAELHAAAKPLVICGPAMCTERGRAAMRKAADALDVPVIGMESPRGINDPGLGAYAEILAEADLVVLIGKPLDFSLRFGEAPAVSRTCNWIVIDPDAALIARAAKAVGRRLLFSEMADAQTTIQALSERSAAGGGPSAWRAHVNELLAFAPPHWKSARAINGDRVHPVEMCRAIGDFVASHPGTAFVSDGGEIGQWAQALVRTDRRLINGIAGTIGVALPFAMAAKLAAPDQPVVAVMGDGTFGFLMAEFDTAVRNDLPVIVVVGNDARWNAEYQIQLRQYGAERARNCDLLPSRYDRVVEALGGFGALVTSASDLPDALERAYMSGKPACINVMIESVAAPVIRR